MRTSTIKMTSASEMGTARRRQWRQGRRGSPARPTRPSRSPWTICRRRYRCTRGRRRSSLARSFCAPAFISSRVNSSALRVGREQRLVYPRVYKQPTSLPHPPESRWRDQIRSPRVSPARAARITQRGHRRPGESYPTSTGGPVPAQRNPFLDGGKSTDRTCP
jgi:hypothetical protein